MRRNNSRQLLHTQVSQLNEGYIMPERPIFEQLVALELRLADLFTRAKEFRRSRERIGYQTVLGSGTVVVTVVG